jgi:Tol biopolymer transport system component
MRNGLIGSALLLLCLASTARAQYFGRNKVQYDRDRVLVLSTAHFDIYYSQEDAAAAAIAGRMAERWHARLSVVLDHALTDRQPIVLYGSHRRFEQTNIYGGLIEESTGGFTDARKRRIVLPFAASLADTDHVLGHEIVHAFQFDIADRSRSPLGVPLWFVEGMAEYLTLGADDPQTAMWMRDAVRSGRLPDIKALTSPRYFPYRWGAALWAYLVERFGDDLPARALRAKRDVKRRLEDVTGQSLEQLSTGWHEALESRYATRSAAATASAGPIISDRRGGGRLNLAASLSPDGRRMVFLSERDQFSIDLYLADARTGRVVRKLLTTATKAEVESLQYLHSSGAWDASGSKYALGTVSRGRATLVVLDLDSHAAPREYPLTQADEIYSPTWSADGSSVAFSALAGGFSDLMVLKLSDGSWSRLTSDSFADLQPAWSPDGRTIAFTTDRFTTDLTGLRYGRYRIGLYDVASETVSPAPALDGVNHLDPEWGPDRSLFFIADPDGVANVFRLDLASSRAYRVTDVPTGVAGVTPVSPALSVAAATGAIAFSVFRNTGYEVHQLAAGETAGTPVDISWASAAPSPAVLTDNSSIEAVPPLPALATVRPDARSYQPRLSLEGIGSPYLSAGSGPLGGYVSGGASMLFGDLLADHQLLTAAYVSSRLDESAFGAMYINRAARWNWGLSLDQAPDLRVRNLSAGLDPEREHVVTRTRERMLWITRRLGAFAAYPLNRSQRIEISGGIRTISFSREQRIEQISTRSGMVIDADSSPLPSAPLVGIAETGIALVGDSAIFGATGPMLGERYRLQVTSNVGGLNYTSLLADYRRYLMPARPYTLAVRLVHSGRYGGDAGDFRLRDAYVGSPALVRGYGPSEVVRSDCPSGSASCPALNTLLASRVVVAKVELRVPLWSAVTGANRVRYGMLPVDAFVFADAGAGWRGEQRFGPGGSDGRFVRSAGVGLRANVFGLVLETAAIKPFDLRRHGWSFAVNLRQGF